ncbi:MAG: ATP-binding protein [Elusimicrobiota bacterium]
MINNIVLQHKLEKDKFLSEVYIPREKLDFAHKFLDTNLIKVIMGSRRVGKSVFSMLFLKDKEFAYLNFDDENILKIKNYDEILKAIFEIYPSVKLILFDEIQNLKNWELFVNRLQRRGFNLILTGSNANLLNKELSTSLTGRYVPIEIFPFSFKEFLQVKGFKISEAEIGLPESKGKILNYTHEYLKTGGFPEVVVHNLEPNTYLATLFDSILLRDVVKRYKVKFTQKIYDLAVYLVTNFSSEFSYTKLRNILGFRSTNTVEKYLKYLEESYLVFSLNRFSYKIKEQIKTPRKIYTLDNGFIAAKSFQFSSNIGRLMENLVFVEILRRGYKLNKDVFYYKSDNTCEVDFVLRKGLKVEKLIQVCYDVSAGSVKDRELKGLIKAADELNCEDLIVIDWDYDAQEDFKGKQITFIPLWKWLVEDKSM